MTASETGYWNEVGHDWSESRSRGLWRRHSDALNCALLADWLPPGNIGRLLKTDLFDEAIGAGLYPMLASRAGSVMGIDVAATTVAAAQSRHPGLLATIADVRRLPFLSGTFDAIVSNSTLDHFPSVADIATSLHELSRVSRPGGALVLTLDNLANPVIALRALLPFGLLNRLGLLPYHVGSTLGPGRTHRLLSQAGYHVQETRAVMHCPRVLAVVLAGLLEKRISPAAQQRFLRWLMRFERLSRWPTRFQTGYFVAVRAVRQERAT